MAHRGLTSKISPLGILHSQQSIRPACTRALAMQICAGQIEFREPHYLAERSELVTANCLHENTFPISVQFSRQDSPHLELGPFAV
jgi:hypothetical protein